MFVFRQYLKLIFLVKMSGTTFSAQGNLVVPNLTPFYTQQLKAINILQSKGKEYTTKTPQLRSWIFPSDFFHLGSEKNVNSGWLTQVVGTWLSILRVG